MKAVETIKDTVSMRTRTAAVATSTVEGASGDLFVGTM